jgi:lipopolysaccharide transport protein LptA
MTAVSREAKKNRRLNRLRTVLLVVVIVVVAAVTLLIWFGRSGEEAGKRRITPAEQSVEPEGELITVGEGFERTFTEGERQLFSVRGASYAVDRAGVVFLEDVDVTLFREDGEAYEVHSGRARVVTETRDAILAEGVTLAGPGGLTMNTRRLVIGSEGNLVESAGEVRFELGPEIAGRANHARVRLGAENLLLTGNVRIASTDRARVPFSLRANRIFVERPRQLLRAEGRVVLRHLYDVLRARRVNAFLAEDERTLRFVRARQDVSGHFFTSSSPLEAPELEPLPAVAETTDGEDPPADGSVPEDSEAPGGVDEAPRPGDGDELASGGALGAGAGGTIATRVEVETQDLRALFAETGREVENLQVEGGADGAAVIRSRTVGQPATRVVSRQISADLGGGVASKVTAGPGVVIEAELEADAPDETLRQGTPLPPVTLEGPLRRVTGARAELSFAADGSPGEMVLEGQDQGVVLTDGDDGSFEARGDRARFDLAEDKGELEGEPTVTVVSSRGRLEAPRILYTRASGIVHGTGGVRARLTETQASALDGTPLGRDATGGAAGTGGATEPIRVEAREGFFRDEPRSFLFRGAVRAWRGQSLLVADELRGDDIDQRLTATGSVRTLWTPDEDADDDRQERERGPLEVTADRLVHTSADDGSGSLLFDGDVTATREGRVLSGDEMEVDLGTDGGDVERIVAEGNVRIRDPAQGRDLQGGRADYDVEAQVIVVTAAPGGKVTMKDKDGNQIQGPRMIYEIDADRVRVLGAEDAGVAPATPATETLATEDGGEGVDR